MNIKRDEYVQLLYGQYMEQVACQGRVESEDTYQYFSQTVDIICDKYQKDPANCKIKLRDFFFLILCNIEITSKVSPAELVEMKYEDIYKDSIVDILNRELQADVERENQLKSRSDVVFADNGTKNESSFITCSCGSDDIDYIQRQTRSADEPMTCFCCCRKCKRRWKMY